MTAAERMRAVVDNIAVAALDAAKDSGGAL